MCMKNIGNRDELHAYKLLKDLGYNKIKCEPLGRSKFPDMSISDNNGSIAVEVTRLNPYKYTADQLVRIDDTLMRNLNSAIESGLKEENIKKYKFKYHVSITLRCKRLKPTKKVDLGKKTKRAIIQKVICSLKNKLFRKDITVTSEEKTFETTFVLFKGAEKTDLGSPTFKINTTHDNDHFCNVNETRVIALKEAISKKSDKVVEIKNQFNEFWLILVDHISTRVDRYTAEGLKRLNFCVESNFDRIILLSKTDIEQRIDLLPSPNTF